MPLHEGHVSLNAIHIMWSCYRDSGFVQAPQPDFTDEELSWEEQHEQQQQRLEQEQLVQERRDQERQLQAILHVALNVVC